MTDQEVTEAMTESLRSLNKLIENLKILHSNTEDTCPVCDFAKHVFGKDIEMAEELRKALIESSRLRDKEKRIIAIASTNTSIVALTDKEIAINEMLDIAHKAFDTIAETCIKRFAIPISPGSSEDLKKALEKLGLHIPDFDPTNVN